MPTTVRHVLRNAVGQIFALSAALTACGTDLPDEISTSVETIPTTSEPASLDLMDSSAVPAPSVAQATAPDSPQALRWTAPLIGGGQIDMEEFAGKQVLLWFWAPY